LGDWVIVRTSGHGFTRMNTDSEIAVIAVIAVIAGIAGICAV
jgi:hypothetical protein